MIPATMWPRLWTCSCVWIHCQFVPLTVRRMEQVGVDDVQYSFRHSLSVVYSNDFTSTPFNKRCHCCRLGSSSSYWNDQETPDQRPRWIKRPFKKKSRLENFHPWIQYTGVLQSSADVQERWPGALATIMPGDRVAWPLQKERSEWWRLWSWGNSEGPVAGRKRKRHES